MKPSNSYFRIRPTETDDGQKTKSTLKWIVIAICAFCAISVVSIQWAFYKHMIPDPPAGYLFITELVLAALGFCVGLVGAVVWRLTAALMLCLAVAMMCGSVLYMQVFATHRLSFL